MHIPKCFPERTSSCFDVQRRPLQCLSLLAADEYATEICGRIVLRSRQETHSNGRGSVSNRSFPSFVPLVDGNVDGDSVRFPYPIRNCQGDGLVSQRSRGRRQATLIRSDCFIKRNHVALQKETLGNDNGTTGGCAESS